MDTFKLLPLTLLLVTQTLAFASAAETPRERISLDDGWRFTKGDAADAGTDLNYSSLRPWILPTGNSLTASAPAVRPEGEPSGKVAFAQPDFDDSQWRLLNLPHDWGIEGPFKQEYPGETGKLPWWGVAWYRKHLDHPGGGRGPENLFGCGRCDVLRERLAQRKTCRRLALWLRVVARGPDAVREVRRGQRRRHPARQPDAILALVSRRRHLPQRLARQNRAGERRPLGHLRHDAGRE